MALVSRVFLSFLLTLFPASFAYFISTYYFLSIQIPLSILIHFIFLKSNLRPCAGLRTIYKTMNVVLQSFLDFACANKIARMQHTPSGTLHVSIELLSHRWNQRGSPADEYA